MPRNNRGVEEGEAVPDLVVPGQRQDQEEDALLVILRRPEKVPGRSAEVYTGEQHLIETKTLILPEDTFSRVLSRDFKMFLSQATDESEASRECVEDQLRKMDRV